MTDDEYGKVRGTLVPVSCYLEPLGRLFVWFCLLEEALDRALVMFLCSDPTTGAIVTKQFTSFVGKTELLMTLAKQRLGDVQLERLQTAIKKMKDANDLRNAIVHGTWGYALGTKSEITLSKKSITKSGFPKEMPLDEAAINDAADAAYRAQIVLDATLLGLGVVRV